MDAYAEALKTEIALRAPAYADFRVNTVFLGGGTPSILPPRLMESVLASLQRAFTLASDAEFTCEANPGALTEEALSVLTAQGVNRLSLGVQAAQPRLLRLLGRIHTFAQAEEAVRLARRYGLSNLNADVMCGLPTQTQAEYLDTLDRVAELGVQHISAYSLIVEPGTPLARDVASGAVRLPDEDAAADTCAAGQARLETHGYQRYEISNYARAGYACRHNLGYWQGAYYLGLGLAAHSMLPAPDGSGACYLRRANAADLHAYLRALSAGQTPPASEERIGPEDAMFEALMLGLRTLVGVDAQRYRQRFGQPLERRYGLQINRLIAEGLAVRTPDALRLTPRGLDMQNAVLLRLMDASADA